MLNISSDTRLTESIKISGIDISNKCVNSNPFEISKELRPNYLSAVNFEASLSRSHLCSKQNKYTSPSVMI